jgi:hypothetical protein
MPDYRLYFVNGQGRFERVSELVADHDRVAIDGASMRRSTVAMELWCGARKVAEWPYGENAPHKSEAQLAP